MNILESTFFWRRYSLLSHNTQLIIVLFLPSSVYDGGEGGKEVEGGATHVHTQGR